MAKVWGLAIRVGISCSRRGGKGFRVWVYNVRFRELGLRIRV